jgi:4-hydroxybenzoate polyprenyltransferase
MSYQAAEKLSSAGDLIRLPKQYGTFLLMFPALWSLFLAAKGNPSVFLVLIFVVGAFLMRSAGCVINDIADRNFDPYVERTKNRPLASGKLNVKEALIVFFLLILLSFLLAMFLNRLSIILCFIGLGLAVIYPFMKRYTQLPQFVLGTAFGWGSVIAWAAVRNKIELPAILIFIATILWTTGYDTIYALMDINDDLKIGVKSTAILFGEYAWSGVAVLFLITFMLLVVLGIITGLGFVYFVSTILAAVFFVYQISKIKNLKDRETAFKMFVSNVGVGGVIFVGIIGSYVR